MPPEVICPSCKKDNPADFAYCRYCGMPLQRGEIKSKNNIWSKLPAWAWILLFAAGVVLVIGSIILFFSGIATVSGFASILFLVGGVFYFGLFSRSKPDMSTPAKALLIGFFAFMGATIDQTGNYFYNKPVEKICCPAGTSLTTRADVSNPLPGTTYIQQDYTCYNDANVPVKHINMFAVIAIRLIEYILLGYIFVWLRWLIWKNLRANQT